MKVYAFDVDETIEISNGPVTLGSIIDLKNEGHVVGLCGNWGLFCQKITNWHQLMSFINLGLEKAAWLRHFKEVIPYYEDYVMVGNVFGVKNKLGFVCGSHDSEAAAIAGWRFIKEDEFATGKR